MKPGDLYIIKLPFQIFEQAYVYDHLNRYLPKHAMAGEAVMILDIDFYMVNFLTRTGLYRSSFIDFTTNAMELQ